MKISQMIGREDFYGILKRTLEKNCDILGFAVRPSERFPEHRRLWINTHLNAIMTAHPSKEVINYLKTEYNVSGSLPRKIAVRLYLMLATVFVKFFAQQGIDIYVPKNENYLRHSFIYPCNKKLRLFRFDKNKVYTILKEGFPTRYFDRETSFRLENSSRTIPKLECISDSVYVEDILDGRPLVRINDKSLIEKYKELARNTMLSMDSKTVTIKVNEYIRMIKEESLTLLRQKSAFKGGQEVALLFDALQVEKKDENLTLVTSHGDFQPGNLWIENRDGNLVIIDWETVKLRSVFYDYAALYLGMRYNPDKQILYDAIKKDPRLRDYVEIAAETRARVVLAEELAYQTEELVSFPDEIGIKEYETVLDQYKRLKI